MIHGTACPAGCLLLGMNIIYVWHVVPSTNCFSLMSVHTHADTIDWLPLHAKNEQNVSIFGH